MSPGALGHRSSASLVESLRAAQHGKPACGRRASVPGGRPAPLAPPSAGYPLRLPRGGGQGKGLKMEVAVGGTVSTRRPWVGCVNFVNEHNGMKINGQAPFFTFCHLLEVCS